MNKSYQEPSALVATPRTLDKSWSRVLRGDRGCAFDAMSLLGAVLTIVSVSLARMELWPWMVAYFCGGLWVLGFLLGTRAQLRSGKQRRLALTEGPLVALGVVEPEAALTQPPGPKGRTGRALVLMPPAQQEDQARNAQDVCEMAQKVAASLDARAAKNPALQALRDDRFSFARVPLDEREASGWCLTRLVINTQHLHASSEPVKAGAPVWAIYHAPSDILEQVLL